MTIKDILKDLNFQEISEIRADSKNRVTLGKTNSMKVSSYKIYRNSLGQLILDPQVTVPANEVWLFQNHQAAQMVQTGLEEAKNKKLVKSNEDFSKHINESN